MLPIKKLVCPTDFSEPSYEALREAGELARHFDAELLVVHAVTPVPMLPYAPTAPNFNVPLYLRELESSAKTALADLTRERVSEGVNSREIVVQGEPADEVVRIAEEEGADLIIIATHGRTGWRRAVFGSVAEKIVRHAEIPVLTIRRQPAES